MHECYGLGITQSLLQRTPAGGKKSERFAVAEEDQHPLGQKLYTLSRQALAQVLQLVQDLFAQEQPYEQVLEKLMPA